MLSDIKACLFDMDGTLIDSMGIWYDVDVEYFKRYNIELPPTYQKDIEGLCMSEIARYTKSRFPFPRTEEEMIEDWNELAFEFYAEHVGYKEGARDFLVWCKNNGIKTGIATSNSYTLYKAVADRLGIAELVDEVVTSEDVNCGKPNPECYLKVAAKLGVEPEKCIVFEDLCLGLQAGKNAGMRTCAVWDSYSDMQDSEKHIIGDYYIDSFNDIAI